MQPVTAPSAGQLNAVLTLIELAKDTKKIDKNVKSLKVATEKYHEAASEYHASELAANEAVAHAEKMSKDAQATHKAAEETRAKAGVILEDAKKRGAEVSHALTAVDKKAQKATKVLDERELTLIDREKKLDSSEKELHERITALEAEKSQLKADITRANALAESALLS